MSEITFYEAEIIEMKGPKSEEPTGKRRLWGLFRERNLAKRSLESEIKSGGWSSYNASVLSWSIKLEDTISFYRKEYFSMPPSVNPVLLIKERFNPESKEWESFQY